MLICNPINSASSFSLFSFSSTSQNLWANRQISSAQSRPSNLSFIRHCIPLSLEPFTLFITLSNISRKRVGDRIHPCLTPFLTSIKSESFPSWEILHLNPSYNILIVWIISLGVPYCCSVSHNVSLFTESNAFSKSIKLTYRKACHSLLCSRIILKVFIKSRQLRCLRNPFCSSRRCCSTVF